MVAFSAAGRREAEASRRTAPNAPGRSQQAVGVSTQFLAVQGTFGLSTKLDGSWEKSTLEVTA